MQKNTYDREDVIGILKGMKSQLGYTSDMPKRWYSYEEIHNSIKDMAQKIKSSDFQPDAMIAIGAGGFIPARILRTFLQVPIYTVTASYYDENGKPKEKPETVQWLDGMEKTLKDKKVLLVDEVDDSRVTLEYCLRQLSESGIEDIAVAVIHEKRKEKKGHFPPYLKGYFSALEVDDIWICYPWDALNIEEQNTYADLFKEV